MFDLYFYYNTLYLFSLQFALLVDLVPGKKQAFRTCGRRIILNKCSDSLQHTNESNPKYELSGIFELLVSIYFKASSSPYLFLNKVSAPNE